MFGITVKLKLHQIFKYEVLELYWRESQSLKEKKQNHNDINTDLQLHHNIKQMGAKLWESYSSDTVSLLKRDKSAGNCQESTLFFMSWGKKS